MSDTRPMVLWSLMSQSTTKPTKWPVCPVKTDICQSMLSALKMFGSSIATLADESSPGTLVILFALSCSGSIFSFHSWNLKSILHLHEHTEINSNKWAGPWENVSNVICKQQRRKSACASTQSDQRLCCSLQRQNDTSSFISEISRV